jgi:tetratricopeptide (TPR) repeat protein
LYSTLRPQGGRVLVGLVPPDRARTLRMEKWMPLKRLLDVNHDSPEYNERHRAGMFYAQSWLLVHMLMLDDYTRDDFPKFVNLVANGVAASEAFEKVWNLPVEYVEKKLTGYSRYRAFNGIWYDLKLQRSEGLEAREADAVKVEIALSAIATLSGRKDEGRARMETLAREHPDDWRVQEALAMGAWRRSDLTAARQHFRRATDLNSPNWATWFNYARVIHGMPDDYETAIRVLRRTLELNGVNQEARVMLAEEYNYAQRYKDALAAIGSIKQLQPEFAARLFLALGTAHAELGNDEEARKAAGSARQHAKETWQLRRAEDLIRHIEVRRQPRPPVMTSPAETPVGALTAPRRPAYVSVTGTFAELLCEGEAAVVKMSTERGTARFVISDPSRISIRGRNGSMTLSCGRQPAGSRITVEHLAGSNEIRAITFH